MEEKHEIVICLGSSCFSRGSKEILNSVKKYLKDHDLEDRVFFHGQLCMGKCEKGPNLVIDDKTYNEVNVESVTGILDDIFS